MKTMLTATALVALLAMPAYANEPQKLTEAQMDRVSAGIFRVPSLRDSGFSIPRLPRVGRVPSVDAIFDLRALLGR
jgi:hypothetical protein